MEKATLALKALSVSDGPSAEIPPTLMNKIPAELRVKIFGFALRADCALGPVDAIPAKGEPVVVNIALFTVCRKVSEEAIEAFYDVNTFRARSMDILIDCRFEEVRYLEVAGDALFQISHRTPTPVGYLAAFFQCLPNVKSVTVPFDTLHRDDRKTVRGLIIGHSRNTEVRCTDIGLFEIVPLDEPEDEEDENEEDEEDEDEGKLGKIYFENVGLRTILPEAKKYAKQYPLGELLGKAWPDRDFGIRTCDTREMTTARCAAWLLQYELFRSIKKGDKSVFDRLSKRESDSMEFFYMEGLVTSSSVPWIHPDLAEGVKLQDITLKEHGPELLEWATEILSLNVWVLED